MSRIASFDYVKSSSLYNPAKQYKAGEYFTIFQGSGSPCTYLVTANWTEPGIGNANNRFNNTLVAGTEVWLGYVEIGGLGLPAASRQQWDYAPTQIALAPGWSDELVFHPAIATALQSERFIPPLEIINLFSTGELAVTTQRIRFTNNSVGIRFFNNNGNWVSGQGFTFVVSMPTYYSPF